MLASFAKGRGAIFAGRRACQSARATGANLGVLGVKVNIAVVSPLPQRAMSMWSEMPMGPPDPILGLTGEMFDLQYPIFRTLLASVLVFLEGGVTEDLCIRFSWG